MGVEKLWDQKLAVMLSSASEHRNRPLRQNIAIAIDMGSQHPSPNVKTLCNFEPRFWPEIIISRDAESTCFKGSRTSCEVIILGVYFGQILAGKDYIS